MRFPGEGGYFKSLAASMWRDGVRKVAEALTGQLEPVTVFTRGHDMPSWKAQRNYPSSQLLSICNALNETFDDRGLSLEYFNDVGRSRRYATGNVYTESIRAVMNDRMSRKEFVSRLHQIQRVLEKGEANDIIYGFLERSNANVSPQDVRSILTKLATGMSNAK